jgi:hypothetical protein
MRSEYAGSLLATLAVGLDSAIRRAARRLAQTRRTPCR